MQQINQTRRSTRQEDSTQLFSLWDSARYTHRDGQNVVYDFAEELKDIVPEVHMLGDAVRARRALDAQKEAYEVALNL